jgi:hydroxyacylglutathione hydrolase
MRGFGARRFTCPFFKIDQSEGINYLHQEFITIRLNGVNCYLAATQSGFILIDTGFAGQRTQLVKALQSAGCEPGNLQLVLLTHGDADHTGNATFLQQKYRAKVAIHPAEGGTTENGAPVSNRKAHPDKISPLFNMMIHLMRFINAGQVETFKPDLTLDENFDLSVYGLDARVLHLPGHTRGSIGILTPGGSLYSGDLLFNYFGRPGCLSIDDLPAHNASLNKLTRHNVHTLYPGHGKPFLAQQIKRGA